MTTPSQMMTIPAAAELYSELVGHVGVISRARFTRYVTRGRLGVEGVDWGRLGDGKTNAMWVHDDAVRRFAAAQLAARQAEVERRAEVWAVREREAATKAQSYREQAAGEVEP